MAAMLIPLGRPGTPEEAAGGVFFLCSPWSNYVHGQVLNVTGGQFTRHDARDASDHDHAWSARRTSTTCCR